MSMLTGQADELRKAALIQEEHTRYDMTLLLTNATDTIRSLRYRVRELRAEKAKLRELMYERAHVYAIQNMTEDELRITATNVMEDNAKLRELVAEMFNACPMCVNCAHNHLTVGWYDRMRELGVEVDA